MKKNDRDSILLLRKQSHKVNDQALDIISELREAVDTAFRRSPTLFSFAEISQMVDLTIQSSSKLPLHWQAILWLCHIYDPAEDLRMLEVRASTA